MTSVPPHFSLIYYLANSYSASPSPHLPPVCIANFIAHVLMGLWKKNFLFLLFFVLFLFLAIRCFSVQNVKKKKNEIKIFIFFFTLKKKRKYMFVFSFTLFFFFFFFFFTNVLLQITIDCISFTMRWLLIYGSCSTHWATRVLLTCFKLRVWVNLWWEWKEKKFNQGKCCNDINKRQPLLGFCFCFQTNAICHPNMSEWS